MSELESVAATSVDLLSPDVVADPYPVLARLQRYSPVVWSEAQKAWLVLQFADVMNALQNPGLSSDRIMPIFATKLSPEKRSERSATYELLRHWMVFNDPPNHTRLRSLVKRAFTPRAVRRLEPRITQIVDELLESLAGRHEIDLIKEFSYLIPAAVIAELMGVPREDVDLFKDWSDCVMSIVFGAVREPAAMMTARRGLLELRDYLADLTEHYRSHPGNNLISDLVAAAESDDRLTSEEIVATCVLLLFGGHETTTNLIGNGTRALIQSPEQREWFLSNPQSLAGAVEELLRFDGPSKIEVRLAVDDLTIGSQRVPAGSQVYLVQAAANRDPAAFDNPDQLNLGRKISYHLGFGFGAHYCLGASIARLEGSIALDKLMRRYPKMAFGITDAEWHKTLISRGMASFPVILGGDT